MRSRTVTAGRGRWVAVKSQPKAGFQWHEPLRPGAQALRFILNSRTVFTVNARRVNLTQKRQIKPVPKERANQEKPVTPDSRLPYQQVQAVQ